MDKPYDCSSRRYTGCYLAEQGRPHRHCACMLPMPVDAAMCALCEREERDAKGRRGKRIGMRVMTVGSPHFDLVYAIATGRLPVALRDRPTRRGLKRVAKQKT